LPVCLSQLMAHQAWAYPSFCSIKHYMH
jgi:hypothetical protein